MIGDFLDSAIATVSPRAGAKRRAYREYYKALKAGVYQGARSHRGTSGWLTMGGSANADIIDDLPALRARSRELQQNDGRASGILQKLVTSVIGTGIRPQARLDNEALGISEQQARDLEGQMDLIWKRWYRHADAGKRLTFYGLQHQAYLNKKLNGESLLLPQFLRRPGRRYDFCLFAVESDRLETPMLKTNDGRMIYGGVETGPFNEPVAYWLRTTHPGDDTLIFTTDAGQNYIRIEAEDARGRKRVLHEYDMIRPGQTRGVPAFSSVLTEFRDLDEYREAERYAMRLAACIGLIIQEDGPLADPDMSGGELTTIDGKKAEAFEPGMVWRMIGGGQITQVNPQRPGENFESFLRDGDRTLAMSQGLSYELAMNWYSDANYSSLRAAFVEARRYFKVEQQDHIHFICQPAWEYLMDEAYLRGELDLPGYADNRDLYMGARWIPQGFDWVDPAKEVKAVIDSIAYNISTHGDEIAARSGGDWQEVFAQRAKEEERKKELDLTTPEQEQQAPPGAEGDGDGDDEENPSGNGRAKRRAGAAQ